MTATVVIVDHDAKYLRKVIPQLARQEYFELLAVAKTYQEGLDALIEHSPNILLTDFDLDGGSGLDLIRASRRVLPHLQTMMLTERQCQTDLFKAIGVGAKGYVLKSVSASRLCEYIRQLIEGGSPMSPYMTRWLIDNINALNQTVEGRPSLSRQELAILTQLSKGYSRDDMAKLNDISTNTVATYIKRIYKKLGVRSKTEAVFEAVQLGLISIK